MPCRFGRPVAVRGMPRAAAVGACGDAAAAGGWACAWRMPPAATTGPERIRRKRTSLLDEITRRLYVGAGPRPSRRHLPDATERFLDVLERIRVAETQIAFAVAAERGPAEAGHPGLIEEQVGELARRHACAGDVRKHIERPVRHRAAEARDVVQ